MAETDVLGNFIGCEGIGEGVGVDLMVFVEDAASDIVFLYDGDGVADKGVLRYFGICCCLGVLNAIGVVGEIVVLNGDISDEVAYDVVSHVDCVLVAFNITVFDGVVVGEVVIF